MTPSSSAGPESITTARAGNVAAVNGKSLTKGIVDEWRTNRKLGGHGERGRL